MGVKSIVDIEINDGAWKQFYADYARYQKLLAASPAEWAKINKQIQGTKAGFADLVKQQISLQAKAKLTAEAAKEAQRLSRTMRDDWKDVARSTKSVATNLYNSTISLLKWGSITGVFSTLLGAGGLFGIDRLANGVSAGRRSAMGLGVGYGQQRAFHLNFGRVVDTETMLGGVNTALHDVTRRAGLYGAGLRESDLADRNTAQVAAALLPRLKSLADATPESQLAQVLRSRGLDQFLSLQDFQRLRRTSRGELAGYSRSFNADQSGLNLDSRSQRVWQDFSVQMSRAGQNIENVFVRGLTPLVPALTELSEAAARSIKAFLEAPKLKEWLDQLGSGLERFAKYVGTDEFQTKIVRFVDGLETVGNAVVKVAGWISNPFGVSGGAAGAASAFSVAGANPGTNAFGIRVPVVKSGSGFMDPGLGALAGRLQSAVPGLGRVTSFNDEYHAGTNSAHARNRAFDITIKDPERSAEIADQVRAELRRLGIAGRVIDEYRNPSARATGGHLHVQTDKQVDVRIFDNTGGNVNISTNQVAQ